VWLDTWLPAAAEVVGYETATSVALQQRLRDEEHLRARVITRGGDAMGLVVVEIDSPTRGSACIEIVATPADRARQGAGMTAAALVERELRDAGVETAYAPAPAMHGISMYFWIRLGYAPLLRPAWPCEREGVAWLRRSLNT
jgi:hypothetical protein